MSLCGTFGHRTARLLHCLWRSLARRTCATRATPLEPRYDTGVLPKGLLQFSAQGQPRGTWRLSLLRRFHGRSLVARGAPCANLHLCPLPWVLAEWSIPGAIGYRFRRSGTPCWTIDRRCRTTSQPRVWGAESRFRRVLAKLLRDSTAAANDVPQSANATLPFGLVVCRTISARVRLGAVVGSIISRTGTVVSRTGALDVLQ